MTEQTNAPVAVGLPCNFKWAGCTFRGFAVSRKMVGQILTQANTVMEPAGMAYMVWFPENKVNLIIPEKDVTLDP